MAPKITISRTSTAQILQKRIKNIGKRSAYVGIPSATKHERKEQLLALAGKITGKSSKSKKRKAKLLESAAKDDINNAELLYIFSKGSPLKNIPPRPVLEPSIEADGNRQTIAREQAGAIRAGLHGDQSGVTVALKRTAMAGQNAVRGWFTDNRNAWKENADSTIKAKGSDRPGIDSGAMRDAIVGVVKDE